MARFLNGTVVTAFAAGLIGGMVAPMLMPNAARAVRPAAKRAIKAGLVMYERGRERVAELGETTGDLMAEARAEREEEIRTERASATAESPAATTVTPFADRRAAATPTADA